jgi:Domain of unknown function (DUF4160)
VAKVYEEDGFKFVIYSDDHMPAHVHVKKAGNMMRIQLDTGQGVKILNVEGNPKDPEIAKAKRLVLANHQLLMEKWREVHGN